MTISYLITLRELGSKIIALSERSKVNKLQALCTKISSTITICLTIMLKNLKVLRKFKDLKLNKKLNLILIFVFVISVLLSSANLSILLQQKAQQVTYKELDALSQIMSATVSFRYKVSNDNNPDIADLNNQYISILTLKPIFLNLHKNANYQDYRYGQSYLKPDEVPTNKFDSYLFERFIKRLDNTTSGFYSFPKRNVFYIARCFVNENNNSKDAVCTRLSDNSIFVYFVYVPASKIFADARQFWLLTMRMLFPIFVVAMGTINLLLNRTIIKPIVQISKDARLVSTGKADVDFEQCSK
ncbi:HAMP domain-containing protein, partial [Chroococcidiopsis cubana]